MTNIFFYVIFSLLVGSNFCVADEFDALDAIPVAYKGRFRPLDAALQLSNVESNDTFWQHYFSDATPDPLLALPGRARSGQWLPSCATR